MLRRKVVLSCLFFCGAVVGFSQNIPALNQQISSSSASAIPSAEPGAAQVLARDSWEYGPFFNGGVGTGDRNSYHFLSVGLHAGKVLTDPHLGGLLRGQFEYAGELMPWWQGQTPKFLRATCIEVAGRFECSRLYPTGGNYNGISVTPIILRWNFVSSRDGKRTELVPFIQGAGGLIWTNHKYPPVGPYQQAGHQGASVFNFTPQFGIGAQYFFRPRQSLTVQANAVHISSASLGDTNPGVNASVQFTVGYTWWR